MDSTRQTALLAVDTATDPAALLPRLRGLGLADSADFLVLAVVPHMASTTAAGVARSAAAQRIERELIDAVKRRAGEIARELGAGEPQVVAGKLVDEVVQAAAVHQPDLVVRLSGVVPEESPPVFGGAEKQLVRKCGVPVLLLNPASRAECRNVAVAVDRTDVGADVDTRRLLVDLILKAAVARARDCGARRVDVIHAWEPFGADITQTPPAGLSPDDVSEYVLACEKESEAWLNDFVTEAEARFGGTDIAFEPRLVQGHARRVVAEECRRRDVDLLVLGTVARRGVLGFLIGNTAEELLDRIGCSVMAVRPGG